MSNVSTQHSQHNQNGSVSTEVTDSPYNLSNISPTLTSFHISIPARSIPAFSSHQEVLEKGSGQGPRMIRLHEWNAKNEDQVHIQCGSPFSLLLYLPLLILFKQTSLTKTHTSLLPTKQTDAIINDVYCNSQQLFPPRSPPSHPAHDPPEPQDSRPRSKVSIYSSLPPLTRRRYHSPEQGPPRPRGPASQTRHYPLVCHAQSFPRHCLQVRDQQAPLGTDS